MAHICGFTKFYFFLLATPLITFTVILICLFLQIGLYSLKNKILSQAYLIVINLLILPWLFVLALDIIGGVSSGAWSLVLELLLPTAHLFLFPVVSILIHLCYGKIILHK